MKRAFRLYREEELCGFLGEGGGRFVSAGRTGLEAPIHPVARYTSRVAAAEVDVTEVFASAEDFDAIVAALEARGFRLDGAPFGELFGGGA